MIDDIARVRTVFLLGTLLCVLAAPGTACAQGLPIPAAATESARPAPVIDARDYRRAYPADRQAADARPPGLPAAVAARVPYGEILQQPPAAEAVTARPHLPAGFVPWWEPHVREPLREGSDVYPVSLDALIVSALVSSPQIRAVSQDVLIQETAIVEAQAAFDVHAFMDSKFFRKSDPIGNVLETGGPPRLREGDFGYSAGLRKRTPLGSSWEVSQRIGMRDSNSRFFAPEQQGNSRLSLSFSQPLLNGFGKPYNTALILLADMDTTVAMDQTSAALQSHLIQIAKAYWELHLQRSVLLQQRQHLQRAQVILDQLAERRSVDSLENQIVRARSAVATRQAELIRTQASIRNVEARLRALTNAPELMTRRDAELIPLNQPLTAPVDIRLPDALVTALQHRPEIDAAAQEIRAASLRLDMSCNELLPALDLVLETYVAGLDQDYDIGQSVVDQFRLGEPSYTAGVVFEVPLHRRAAKARYQKRQLQLRQMTQQFDQTVQVLLADVEIAVREVSATYGEMMGKYRAMLAAEAEMNYLTERWQLLAGDDRAASFLLEDLLDAQDRLAVEEFGFSIALRDYTFSQTALKKATGTLLEHQQIEPVRVCRGGLPELRFERAARLVSPDQVLPAQSGVMR